MRTSFSPTLEAARRLASRAPQPRADTGSTPPVEARWCDWPRRAPAAAPRVSIWQALREIQTRHA